MYYRVHIYLHNLRKEKFFFFNYDQVFLHWKQYYNINYFPTLITAGIVMCTWIFSGIFLLFLICTGCVLPKRISLAVYGGFKPGMGVLVFPRYFLSEGNICKANILPLLPIYLSHVFVWILMTFHQLSAFYRCLFCVVLILYFTL